MTWTHIEQIEALKDLVVDLLDALDPEEPLTDEYYDRFKRITEE